MRKCRLILAAVFLSVTVLSVPVFCLAAGKDSLVPKLKIAIPTVTLTEPQLVSSPEGDTYYIPWLGQYMRGIYAYAVTIVSIIAAVVIIIGGIRWAAAGGNSSGVSKGREMIMNGLIGLLLSIGTYAILYIVNPDLVKFKSLSIKVVKQETVSVQVLDKGLFEQLAKIGIESNPQLAGLVCDTTEKREPDENECYNGRPGSAPAVRMDPPKIKGDGSEEKDVLLPYVYAAGKAWNMDPCLAYATIYEESKWVPGNIGHDEDFDTNPWTVPSRMRHLASSDPGCGFTVTSKAGVPFQQLCKDNPEDPECKAFDASQKGKCKNQPTHPFKNNPPDFGLDWQYSHGIGLGQNTLFTKSFCPNGQRGITYEDNRPGGFGSRCYTPPELLNPTTSIDALYRELAGIRFAKTGTANRSPETTLTYYICSNCEKQAEGRIKVYNTCRTFFQSSICGIECTSGGCRANASNDTCDNYEEQMKEWRPPKASSTSSGT